MGKTGAGAAEVLIATRVMKSVHTVGVVEVGEAITETITRIEEAGGLEAEVLDVIGAVDEAEVEVLLVEGGGIGVQLGKVVLRDGLKLSNGIGKESRVDLIIGTIVLIIMITIATGMRKMKDGIMIHRSISIRLRLHLHLHLHLSKENMTTEQSAESGWMSLSAEQVHRI